ncbi:5-(carboxyamino)imidazole ribonucleotide synthase [Portibacter lacus]|uniref:N5-carboxyaminoimidazole ribonucleotide synthase n=1 Tax=Portibacter lacus TaxID=1099794 RepID=A0AA37WD25_9BACT|nr:5-(carboxyamino)imidazole ribonucleotide synthase [Portibacter lacus]GLR16438.1 N5-carboxyaminoimidazole ribonucleotide synthase [Portibacter lacus]
MNYRKKKVGVLGGGQLGRMMYETVLKWDLDLHFMDQSRDFPVGKVCPNFEIGDFSNYDDVIRFGEGKDIVTIEIEAVNLEALRELRKRGVIIHPSPDALKIINDKGLQKMFYESYEIPSAAFQLFQNIDEVKKAIQEGGLSYPFVQKVRTGGYDGKGVSVIKSKDDLPKLLEGPCLTEDLVPIDKEIGVIIARNESGEMKAYDPVEMVFDEEANLVDYLFAPAHLSSTLTEEAIKIAKNLITKFDICGLLAVEFFLTKDGKLMVNEVAPRCHNSGHHSIEACETSQFEQHIRGVMNMPLGNTHLKSKAVMVNLLGEANATGEVRYQGMHECLEKGNVNLHFYGKSETKPFRKMGHATILEKDINTAIEKAKFVKENLIVTT